MKKRIIKKDPTINLKWHGPMPNRDLEELEHVVKEDIERSLKGLKKPGDLIFHTVFVGETMDDENVIVWGEEDDPDTFHCEYAEKAEWVSFDKDGNEL